MITFPNFIFGNTQCGSGQASGSHPSVKRSTGFGKGRAWGEDWEGEPYVYVEEYRMRITCLWSLVWPLALSARTEVP